MYIYITELKAINNMVNKITSNATVCSSFQSLPLYSTLELRFATIVWKIVYVLPKMNQF